MRPARVDRGLAVFECIPDEPAYSPIGLVHGGLDCALADSVPGCAVHTTLTTAPGQPPAHRPYPHPCRLLRPVCLADPRPGHPRPPTTQGTAWPGSRSS